MARVSIYLNFVGTTEEAFAFYGSVFGSQPRNLQRMREVPAGPAGPLLSEAELDMVMHVELEILDGTVLMASDMLASMGHRLVIGNNTTINLELDDLDEANRIFAMLADGAGDITPLTPMFWGAYWGTCLDRYGIRWMVSASPDGAPGA